MNTQEPSGSIYATMLTDALAAPDVGVSLLCLALRMCAEPRVIALLRHASAMVKDESRDGSLDAEAAALVPAVVRVMGSAMAASYTVEPADEQRLLAALAEVEHFMEGYESAALLAGEAVWQELSDAALFPELGGAWWNRAYADSLDAQPC